MLRTFAVFLALTFSIATGSAEQSAVNASPAQPVNASPPQPANASPAQPGGGLLGRPSPPQPLQKQGVDYFVGSWNFRWTGRESPLTAGPRTGMVTFTRLGDSPFLEVKTEGTSDAAGTYKETGTLGWQETQKVLALHERFAGNVEMLSVGDWSSPIAIRFEGAPIRVRNQTLRLRRVYAIVSASSFTVNEELSTDGGPFVRLGGGVFSKAAAK
jgi:hypothetical protein